MYLMVLNDGETYTNLEGCMIVRVPDYRDMEGIEEELKVIHNQRFESQRVGDIEITQLFC